MYRLLGIMGALATACIMTAIGWGIDYTFGWHVNATATSNTEYGAICFIIGLLASVVAASVGVILAMIVAAGVESLRDAWRAARERASNAAENEV